MLAPGDLCGVLAEVQHLGVGWVVVTPYGTPLKLILQIFLLLTGPLIKKTVKFVLDKDFDARITFDKFNVRGRFRAIVTGQLLVKGS